jgi:hypothetical protein
VLPYVSAACAFVLASVIAGDAMAFCRSTTCRGEECPKDAKGCPVTGAKLFWPTRCLSFSLQKNGTINLDRDRTRAAIMRAFQHWSDVDCGEGGRATMTFTPTEDVSCKKSAYDPLGPNVNVVMFQDEEWKYRGLDATLAKTSVTFSPETGEIFDADIEVNTANNPYTVSDPPATVKYDVEAVLTHEVGHFLGLAHSKEGAVMDASYNSGSIFQRELQPDDIAAVCAVYPPGRAAACSAEPRGGMLTTCEDPPPKTSCGVNGAETQGAADLWPAGAVVGACFARVRKRARRAA